MSKRRSGDLPAVGDTFAVAIAEGLCCVVRVISVDDTGNTSLVAFTPWLGPRPAIDEPKLRDVLREHRESLEGTQAISWYAGRPPSTFELIGRIPPTAEEAAHEAKGSDGGVWNVEMVGRVLLEAAANPSAFEASMASFGARHPTEAPSPPRDAVREVRADAPMADDEFWSCIALLDWGSEDADDVVEPLVAHLASLSPERIAAFDATLCIKLFELDHEDLARAIGDAAFGGPMFSPDHFLDVRCAVVANGRAYHERVVSRAAPMPDEVEFEELASVAHRAYERATNDEVVFVTSIDASTFANVDGWRARS